MKLNTMSAVMTFVSKIEGGSASFYEAAAEKHSDLKNAFLAWAKENKKNEKQVKQTYFGVITDTLESNYCFEGLNTDDYPLDLDLPEGADEARIKEQAARIEKTIQSFYLKAAGLSEGLMADIPRLFKKIASKREGRQLD